MIEETTITRAIVERYAEKFLKGTRSDVCVVGGGPSGLVCARYLAEKGLSVSLFEKKMSLGGGIWGGGMSFNKVVVQKASLDILEDFGVGYEPYDDVHYVVDAVELASGLIYAASKAGVLIFNLCEVQDVMIRDEGVTGLVVNWTTVGMTGLHVDPVAVGCRAVVDATGHEAVVCDIVAKKTGKLELKGEKYMWAERAEDGVEKLTSEVFPGLFVAGMSVAAVYGLPRMGPIFGGMLLSGRRAAELVAEALGRTP